MQETDEAELQPLKDLLARSRGLEHAPESLVQKALDAFDDARRPASARQAPPSALRRLLAVLAFDELGTALSPVRGAGTPARRLVFSAGEVDVALSVMPGAERGTWRIDGQCFGDDEPGAVQLTSGEKRLEVPWNTLGEFGLEPVPAGECRLVLRSANWEVTLPPFEIPPD
jgi:hypothetical protein